MWCQMFIMCWFVWLFVCPHDATIVCVYVCMYVCMLHVYSSEESTVDDSDDHRVSYISNDPTTTKSTTYLLPAG